MKRIWTLLIVFVIVGYACSKKVTTPKVQAPDYTAFHGSTELVTHLSLSKQLLVDTIDGIMDVSFNDPFVTDPYDLEVKVKRYGASKINGAGKALLLTIPLQIDLNKKTLLGNITGNGVIEISVNTNITISPEWKLKTQSSLLHHTWIAKPKINLGISIPAQYFSDLAIKEIAPLVLEVIDDEMSNNIDLKSLISDAMISLQSPFQVANNNLWYQPQVSEISLSPLIDMSDKIDADLYLKATNYVRTSKPNNSQKSSKVPPFSWKTNGGDSSSVSLLFDLGYEEVTRIVNDQFKGQIFVDGPRSVTVTQVSVSGVGGKLGVKCSLVGSYNGDVVFEGLPYFDKADLALKVRDVDVNFKTKNLVAKGAEWLLKGRIRRELTSMLTIPLNDYKGDIQEQIDLTLSDYYKENHLYMYVRLGSFDVHSLYFSDQKINGIVQFKLYMSAYLNDKRFFDK